MNEKPEKQARDRVQESRIGLVSGSAKVTKLRALAADPAATENEKAVALRKADVIERKQPATPRITERGIDKLPVPESGSIAHRHIFGVKGLGLRVTAAGARSWILDYVCNGIQRQYTIGPRHALSLKAATVEATRLHGLIATGVDPFDLKAKARADAAAKREAERRARDPDADPTVAYLAERWLADAERTLRRNTILGARTCLKRLIEQKFDQKKVAGVTRADVKALMAALHKTPMLANRCRAFLSTIFNFGIANGIGLTEANVNPARRVKGVLTDNRETPRRVIVPTQKQIDSFHAALDARAHLPSADALRLLLWTGARKNEVLGLEWSEIDLDGPNPVWLLPARRAKQKKDRAFPLADPQVLEMLRRLHAKNGTGKYVFPGLRAGAPLRDITHLWYAVRDEAGLQRFHLHDLRHVWASRGLSSGVPIFTVGELLGHSSAFMTSRYGHLSNQAAAEAAKLIGGQLAPTKPSAPDVNQSGANHA